MIVVNAGQCAIVVDNGQIAELCAEPGEYIYSASTEPSLFYGSLGDNIKASFAQFGKRFAFGGELPKDQRVYYINIKEVRQNLWGTSNPIPFFISDQVSGFQGDINLMANGEYSFKISDPIRFYTNIATNFNDRYTKDDLKSIMRSDFMTALQPALGALSDYGVGIRYSAITTKTDILVEKLNEQLSKKWAELRGIVVVDVTFNSLKATDEDEARIKKFQDQAVYTNVNMAAARMVDAQANAMEAAAANESAGPMMAFAGMNMAQMAGGGANSAANLFAMGQQQQQQQAAPQMAAPSQAPGWTCAKSGKGGNTGKFCAECGAPQPADGWTCSCGAVNKGKFCAECGKQKPAGAPLYKCDKCGWEPEDPMNPPKFCPECGDVFDENDVK
jgi:membrane protease subunit (stomatin/prohibitin family)